MAVVLFLVGVSAYGVTQWSQVTSVTTNGLEEVVFPSASVGYIAGHYTILKTTNGGTSWTEQSCPVHEELISLDFVSETEGWIVGYNGTLLHTTNGGSTWTEEDPNTSAHLQGIFFLNQSTGWLFGNSSVIRKTTNGGSSWSSQSSPVSTYWIDGQFVDANNGYACGGNGKVMKTNNGGSTWVDVSPGSVAPSTLLSCWVVDANTAWVCGIDGKILKTTNGGSSWTVKKEFIAAWPEMHYIGFVSASHGFVGSNSSKIWETTDGGETWEADTVWKWVLSISFPTANSGFAVGGQGGMYKANWSGVAPPDPPTNLVATALSETSIGVTWEDHSSDEDGFKLDRRVSGDVSADAWVRVVTTTANDTSETDTGLTAGTKYYFKVKAYNAGGNSSYSNVDDATTPGGDPPPAAPTNLTATAVSSTQIDLAWEDQSSDEDGFRIDRRKTGVTTWTVPFVSKGANTSTHSDTGLPAEMKYYYRVRAYNGGGESSNTAVADATTLAATPPPAAPTNLTATAVSSTQIDLAWEDQSSDEDGFRIDRRKTGVTTWTVPFVSKGANTSTHSDSGLPAETKFYYRVRAYNAGGESSNTAVADDTTSAGAQEKVAKDTDWRWRKGTAEASSPAADWRERLFDDSGWSNGPAPFGYAGGGWPTGTELDDMQYNYFSAFLRRAFTLADPALVEQIALDIDFDDGFIAWVNGEEIARVHIAGAAGSFVAFDGNAEGYVSGASSNWTATLTGGEIPELRTNNVLAVQVFNISTNSSDLMLNASLSIALADLPGAEDADGDVMPDNWEIEKLGNTNQSADVDTDSDGVSNIGEYIGGTHPDNSNEFFAVSLFRTNDDVIVSFPTVTAAGTGYTDLTRYYALQQKELDGLHGWAAVPGYEQISGGGDVSYTNSGGAQNPTLFRGRTWLE